MEEARQVKIWLSRQYKVEVPDDWLQACIQWIHEEHPTGVSVSTSQTLVYEQWLMSDLREIGAVCLPGQLSSHLSTFITGCFNLQVMNSIDVSGAMYSQLQKARGTQSENEHVSATTQFTQEPKSGRLLKLTLTDGQQEVQAIEYKPIPQLDLNAGCKIQVYGRVMCRRGVLFLTRDCVRVLGGEVEALEETTTPEIVLSNALEKNVGLGHNPPNLPSCKNNNPAPAKKPTQQSGQINRPQNWSSGRQSPTQHTQNPVTHTQQSTMAPVDNVDEWGDDFDDDTLLSQMDIPDTTHRPPIFPSQPQRVQATQPTHNPPIRSQPPVSMVTPNRNGARAGRYANQIVDRCHGDGNRGDVEDYDEDSFQPEAKRRLVRDPRGIEPEDQSRDRTVQDWVGSNQSQTMGYVTPSVRDADSNIMDSHSDFLNAESDPFDLQSELFDHEPDNLDPDPTVAEADPMDLIIKGPLPPYAKGVELSCLPYTYLSVISEHWPPSQTVKTHVKAFISTLTSKLEHNGGIKWSLSAKINDGSAALDVDISDQVNTALSTCIGDLQMLSELIGFSAQQCMDLKPRARTDPQVRERIGEGLKRCQRQLVDLCCILHLDLIPGETRPLVTGYSPVTAEIIQALKTRVLATH